MNKYPTLASHPPEYAEFRNQVIEHKRILENAFGRDIDVFIHAMNSFRLFLVENSSGDNFIQYRKGGDYIADRNLFRKWNNEYMRATEIKAAMDIINPKTMANSVEDRITNDMILRRYRVKAIELACLEIKQGDHVVCVGCGAFPETMIHFLENTPASLVTGLDDDSSAASVANMMVGALGYTSKTPQVYGIAGEAYSYHNASVIHIAGFVPDKAAVLKRILATAPQSVQITTEAFPLGMMNILYDNIEDRIRYDDDLGRLYIDQKIESGYDYCNQTILKLGIHP